jgi:hypothetical protein
LYPPPRSDPEGGLDVGVFASLVSSAIAGVVVSAPPTLLAFSAEVAELGTRLIMGLMPDELSVLLLDIPSSDCEYGPLFDNGVGGTEPSSFRVNA